VAATESERREALEALLALHGEIDEAAAEVAERLAGRLRCARGCSDCCVDDLRVWPIEAERIRRRHASLLREGDPHPVGGCAFLDDEGACRIYADRPSVCRSQGLPLRVIFEDERGEVAERRDICPLNLEGLPALDRLSEEDCWLVGPYELRLAALDARFSGRPPEDDGETTRVALRSLFSSTPESVPPTTPR
jgi:Fe-S-cluster containining protein